MKIKYMGKFFVVMLLLQVVVLTTLAQPTASMPDRSGSTNFYGIDGFQYFHFDNLNKALTANGFPEVKTSQNTLGFGGYGTMGRIVLGGEGVSFSNVKYKDTVTTESNGGLGYLYVGYKIVSTSHFDIFPLVGIGLGGVHVTISQKQPDIAFSNFLSSPLNEAKVGMGNFFYNLSAEADYRLREKNTLFAGLRSGYNVSGVKEWKADTNYFVDAPKDRFANMYIQLIVGISIGK